MKVCSMCRAKPYRQFWTLCKLNLRYRRWLELIKDYGLTILYPPIERQMLLQMLLVG
jgi:hypothetical protein